MDAGTHKGGPGPPAAIGDPLRAGIRTARRSCLAGEAAHREQMASRSSPGASAAQPQGYLY